MSSFVVVTCGFPPAPLRHHPSHEVVRQLPAATDDGFLEAGLQLLGATGPGVPIVLVLPDRPQHVRRARLLRAIAREQDVIPFPVARPLTALAATATWLSSMAQRRIGPGLALAQLEMMPGLLPTYAVVSSVTRLERPRVGVMQHLGSWVPGTTFGVVLGATDRVRAGRLTDFGPSLGHCDAVVRGAEGYAAKMAGLPVTGERVVVDGVPPAGTDWWGRVKHYEATLVPSSVIDGIRALGQLSFVKCGQCDAMAAGACPVCQAQVEGAA